MSDTTARDFDALRIVRVNSGWSAAAGLAPVPLLDLAAISALQLRMIKQLASLYGVPFRKDLVKSLIGAALGGTTALMIAAPVGSMLKLIPVVGAFASTFVTPTAGAATTYALGKVFIQHFEAGGTLLDMEPEALRRHFSDEYKQRDRAAAATEGAPASS